MEAMLKHNCCYFLGTLCFFLVIFTSRAVHITHLPGFDGALPFHLETGYVTTDNESGTEYFYYFVESERNPSEDPLLLWLIGGPYCSAFIGLAYNMGPLIIKGDGFDNTLPTLVYNPYSWTKISSLIFLDWPVGTGFSFSRTVESYNTNDLHSSEEIYKFLKEWLLLHPHFLTNPFYIGGDSYAGKVVPLVTKNIVQGNQGQSKSPVINLKGYLVGNGLTDNTIDDNAQVTRAHGLGIIPDELFELIVESCKGNAYLHPANRQCAENMEAYNQILSGINTQNILATYCHVPPKEFRWSIMDKSVYLHYPPSQNDKCRQDERHLANLWANNPLSWEALHIVEGSLEKWQYCRAELEDLYTKTIQSVAPEHLNLLKLGYRALVYSGDHDLVISYVGTLEWIRSLNLSIIQGWRSWHAGGQVAGYTILFSKNLTFATILGGSHTPSFNRPMQSFAMFQRWISHELL